ncbi:RNA polymerase sigma factor SigZ [Pseudoalteromonas luteoviolacea]|uniref:RNA polymerase sigma factor SigZ n=1 Tax=Pseudoalteromonas luteoviolacea TaxID=43657 RepID=UPI001F3FE149|nr:RNA polymerase sigma factor SigZ [Pseudoalteromonas luteoviolacea]MCF6442988.1 RNA polymerase sigma factor SigZ [Pseudoalteromonas luteoviolacea]
MTIEEIWQVYRSSLKAFLHSKVSNPDDVEDLLQDVLLKTHLAMHSLNKKSSIKAWLFQIAHHTVIDHYRKNGQEKHIESQQLWYESQQRNIKMELAQCIRPFIQALPEKSASLLEEVELEGKSQKQLAQELSISYSTVKSRVQKARTELNDVFHACCDYDLDKRGNLIEYHPKADFNTRKLKPANK